MDKELFDKRKEQIHMDARKRSQETIKNIYSDDNTCENHYEDGTYGEFRDVNTATCSGMDYTGLMPVPPQSDDELEAYDALYPSLPTQIFTKSQKK